jgi:glycosyltransferase involved in cell wall biosynthesis
MITPCPLVTVVIPSFNEDPHIVRSSLESIRDQTFTDFECIVVDDSTNPSFAEACRAVCAEDQRFVYIHPTERLGLPKSLNLAISKARGQLIARFDSDDICMAERLELQVVFLQAHPEISAVGGAMDVISSEGKFIAHRSYPETSVEIAKRMQLTTSIAHPTVMFRKDVFDQVGGYNTDFRFAEDLDLWLRWINARHCFANLPQVLVRYRQDKTHRNQYHWRCNLRARISNFSYSYSILRIFGIACIATWAVLPSVIQGYIFKLFILHRRIQGVSR